MTPTEPNNYPLPPIPATCAGTCIDTLLNRFERASDLASLAGVPVLLNSCDAFTIIEWVKSLTAERNVLRETVDRISVYDPADNSRLPNGIHFLQKIARETLDRLYGKSAGAPGKVVYPVGRE